MKIKRRKLLQYDSDKNYSTTAEFLAKDNVSSRENNNGDEIRRRLFGVFERIFNRVNKQKATLMTGYRTGSPQFDFFSTLCLEIFLLLIRIHFSLICVPGGGVHTTS